MAEEKQKLAYRPAELAEATGTSVAFIRKQISEKKLSARKVGDAVIVLKKDAEKWLNSAAEVV